MLKSNFQDILVGKLSTQTSYSGHVLQFLHKVEQANGVHAGSEALELYLRGKYNIPLGAEMDWATGQAMGIPPGSGMKLPTATEGSAPATINWQQILADIMAALPYILQLIAIFIPAA